MKLMWSPASPFVRKVLVVAHELGVAQSIELLSTRTNGNQALYQQNPIGKIPTLLLDDGAVLFDSPVICEYLDSVLGGGRLLSSGNERWTALCRQALADGILDAGLLARLELRRTPDKQLDDQLEFQLDKVRRGMDRLEAEAGSFGDGFGIGEIAAACAVAWLGFRFAEHRWLDSRPNLRQWYGTVANRPSLLATAPQDWA